MKSLLLALRKETKDIHAALHINPVLKRCQENQLVLVDYIQMLLAFYQPWKEIINSIEHSPIAELRPLLLKRYQLLYNDLVALNVDERSLIPLESELVSEGKLVGICYVVIGSSMGATQLSQNVKTTLGNQPVSYLSMTPQEAGWPILSSFINSKQVEDYQDSCTAARKAFELIQTHLCNSESSNFS